MLEPGLILSLGSFLQIQHLFLCSSNHDDGLDDGMAKFTSDQTRWPTASLDQTDIMDLLTMDSYVVDMTLVVCQDFDNSPLHGFVSRHFGKNIVWLVPDESLQHASTLPLRLDSFLIGHSTSRGGGDVVNLKEYYALKGNVMQNELGKWSARRGLEVSHRGSTWERRSDMGGIVLNGGYVPYQPAMCFKDKEGNIVGLIPDLVHMIQEAVNFR